MSWPGFSVSLGWEEPCARALTMSAPTWGRQTPGRKRPGEARRVGGAVRRGLGPAVAQSPGLPRGLCLPCASVSLSLFLAPDLLGKDLMSLQG